MPRRLRFLRDLWPLCSWLSPAWLRKGRHGLSAFGELKYPADFKHFDWVNPDAPKGRSSRHHRHRRAHQLRQLQQLHPQGRCGAGPGIAVRFADDPRLRRARCRLRARRRNRPRCRRPQLGHVPPAPRGEIRRRLAAHRRRCRLHLRYPEGEGPSALSVQLRDMTKAEALDARTVRYSLHRHADARSAAGRGCQLADPVEGLLRHARVRPDHARSAAGLGPLPARRFQAGRVRQLSSAATTTGPRICPSTAAASISTSCASSTIATAPRRSRASRPARSTCARSSPRAIGPRATTSPPSRRAGCILLTLPDESPSGAQGFFLNTRRPKLADIRVRKALDYAFDFEWTNKNIFYGLYTRTESFFENSDMKASGKPSPAELALLEPFRGQLPAEVFDEPYTVAGLGRLRPGPQAAARSRRGCWARPAGRSRTASASMPTARCSSSSS